MKGCFITLEGPDGAGKTTQARGLAQYLLGLGMEVILTREPGGTSLGEQVRGLLLDPNNSHMRRETEALLYGAARAQLVAEEIKPALEQGKVVICDRFTDSTLAYQGYGRGMDLTLLKAVNRLATGGLEPDLTFLLDLEPKTGLKRIRENRTQTGKGQDRMERENLEFHLRVREGYLALAREFPERIMVIPAHGEREGVESLICQAVGRLLRTRSL